MGFGNKSSAHAEKLASRLFAKKIALRDHGCNKVSKRTFLDLPGNLRSRVYEAAGLFNNFPIVLNHGEARSYTLRKTGAYQQKHLQDAYLKQVSEFYYLCHSLLLVSHAVYAEISQIVYSTYEVIVFHDPSIGLQPLRNLTNHSIAHLRYLTVYVSRIKCSCTYACGHTCSTRMPTHPRLDTSHGLCIEQPDEFSPDVSSGIFEEWRATAEFLKLRISPEQLTLRVLCEVKNLKSAVKMTNPILSLPTLRECAIRLSSNHEPALSNVAEKTVLCATKRQRDTSTPFRYRDLPRILQIKILDYTDLIAPGCRIFWVVDQGFHLQPDRRGSMKKKCAGSSDGAECYCRVDHTAYVRNCRCWAPPRSLFLVSRRFRELALIVFLAKNHFIILRGNGGHDITRGTRIKDSDSPAWFYYFFTAIIPSRAARYLRSLEFVFATSENIGAVQETAALEWYLVVAGIKDWLRLPGLTLTISMFDTEFLVAPVDVPHPQRLSWYNDYERQEIVDRFIQYLAPVTQLRPLKNLFIHLEYINPERDGTEPLGKTFASALAALDDLLDARRNWEITFEQSVNGNCYRSHSQGKEGHMDLSYGFALKQYRDSLSRWQIQYRYGYVEPGSMPSPQSV